MSSIAARLGRLERPVSSAAFWCERFALFAVPFLAIVVAGHKIGALDTRPVFWLLGVGALILIASLLLGARALHQMWVYGHKGGVRATRGLFVATLLFLPYFYLAFQAFALPSLYDISTDLDDPPQFETVLDDRTDDMNPIVVPDDGAKAQQLQAYPRVSARRYPLGSGRVFKAVIAVIAENDWVILTSNTVAGDAPIDEEGSGLVAKPATDADDLPLRPALPDFRPPPGAQADVEPGVVETQQVSPVGREDDTADAQADERIIEAVASSFFFGFQSDVVIRLIEEEDGTLVDMRSVSRYGAHDIGGNAARIVEFMDELDAALQGLGQGG